MQNAPPGYTTAQHYPSQQYGQYPGHQPQQYGQFTGPHSHQSAAAKFQHGTVQITPVPLSSGPPPPDYCGRSIIALFCCWPIGIFAIMKSMQSRDARQRGDMTTAHQRSLEANRFFKWAVYVGVACMAISILINIIVRLLFSTVLSPEEPDWDY